MMIALILYAFARGLRSSRAIERACEEDVASRVIAAQQRPDHASAIARFVERHTDALAGRFAAMLGLCAQAGIARVGLVAIDPTKALANSGPPVSSSSSSIVDSQTAGQPTMSSCSSACIRPMRGRAA